MVLLVEHSCASSDFFGVYGPTLPLLFAMVFELASNACGGNLTQNAVA